MTKEFAAKFRIKPGTRAHLGKRDAADDSAFPDRKAAEQQSAKDGAVINEWQDKLYAEGTRALLVVLQGVDTAGKDGTVRHVFNQTGPLGVTVTSFRAPSGRSWRTISCGAPISHVRAAGSLASSIARTTRMCWLAACAS